MKIIVLIFIVIIILIALGYIFSLFPTKKSTDMQAEQNTLDPVRIGKEINNGQAVLLDVRTAVELEQEGYAVGAVHYDVARLQNGELPEVGKSKKIYLYCRSGRRAETAKNILNENGYTDVINIGGLADWIKANGEIVK